MTDLKFIEAAVDAQAERILDANDRIWEYAEPPFKESQRYNGYNLYCRNYEVI